MKKIAVFPVIMALILGPVLATQSRAATTPSNSGYWKLTDTLIYDYNKKVVNDFEVEVTDTPYPFSVSGELGDVNVTQSYVGSASPKVDPYSISVDYQWTTPPLKANAGEKFPAKLVMDVVASENWHEGLPFILTFDHVDVTPGMTSGWTYPGSGMGGWDGPKNWESTMVFPKYTDTLGWAADKGRVRLQVETRKFAVQYVYTWVPVKYTITCVLAKKKVKVTGLSPVCPKGYKQA